MKNVTRIMMSLTLVVALASCRDKAAEKRIAELESRISQMEGNKGATATATPAAAASPAAD